jgi:hypothetical protein
VIRLKPNELKETKERQIYWRLHWPDLPAFNAKNAWSQDWGTYGEGGGVRGYSALESAEDLVRYFQVHAGGLGNDVPIVVFAGYRVGTGADREPLVVPTQVIAWIRGRDLDEGILEHEDDPVRLAALLNQLGSRRRLRT